MEITGKVHCFFEQSGTFKNEFIKLGIPAEDYDIQNNFGETDNVVDLFKAIEDAYEDKPSLFDTIERGDLIVAFFPCIHFCDAKTLLFRGTHNSQRGKKLAEIMENNISLSRVRQIYFDALLRFVAVCSRRKLRCIIENPWNTSRGTYLQHNFIPPSFVDTNRMRRGDYYVKPTAYWFLNCRYSYGCTYQNNKKQRVVYKTKDLHKIPTGVCSEERSMISPDYARNFICDFILGKAQRHTQLNLFN